MFNSFVKSLTRALRTLLEVTSLNMLLRGDAKRAREDFLDIALSLPFQIDVNTGFGILAKVYLDALTHINGRQCVRDANAEGVREAKQLALEICEETFPGIKNPKGEVERGFRFWDCVSAFCSLISQYGRIIEPWAFFFVYLRRLADFSCVSNSCVGGPRPSVCLVRSHGICPIGWCWYCTATAFVVLIVLLRCSYHVCVLPHVVHGHMGGNRRLLRCG